MCDKAEEDGDGLAKGVQTGDEGLSLHSNIKIDSPN